jgi:hypothetical protein
MGSRKGHAVQVETADINVRNQEVQRANRELAAYFKGKRTEREARSALKIIKAFIRDREKIDPSKRSPLPGGNATGAVTGKKKSSASGESSRQSST